MSTTNKPHIKPKFFDIFHLFEADIDEAIMSFKWMKNATTCNSYTYH